MCLPVKPFKIEREWEHAGMKCAVVQAREASHRCAYVRVPPTHPLYDKSYDEAGENVNAHGGFTFAEPEPCEHEDGVGWWFGFDFAHCDDAIYDPNPDMAALSPEGREYIEIMRRIHSQSMASVYGPSWQRHERKDHYWTQAEVEKHCEDVAEQLAAIT